MLTSEFGLFETPSQACLLWSTTTISKAIGLVKFSTVLFFPKSMILTSLSVSCKGSKQLGKNEYLMCVSKG